MDVFHGYCSFKKLFSTHFSVRITDETLRVMIDILTSNNKIHLRLKNASRTTSPTRRCASTHHTRHPDHKVKDKMWLKPLS